LTQENIAEYLGVSIPAVSKWENGTTYPDITLLPGLARLLKIDVNELLSFHEELSDIEIENANQGLKAREGGRKTAQKSRECKYVANKSHNTLLRCLRQ